MTKYIQVGVESLFSTAFTTSSADFTLVSDLRFANSALVLELAGAVEIEAVVAVVVGAVERGAGGGSDALADLLSEFVSLLVSPFLFFVLNIFPAIFADICFSFALYSAMRF